MKKRFTDEDIEIPQLINLDKEEENLINSLNFIETILKKDQTKKLLNAITIKKKKKTITYLENWKVFLKALIDIGVDINLLSDFNNLTEYYINIIPDIKKIAQNITQQIKYSRLYNDALENYEMEKETYLAIGDSEANIDISEEAKIIDNFSQKIDYYSSEYILIIQKICNLDKKIISVKDYFTHNTELEKIYDTVFKNFIFIYSHINVFREIMIIYDNFLNANIFFETLPPTDFSEKPIEIYEFFQDDFVYLRKKMSKRLEEIKKFQSKEHKELEKETLKNIKSGGFNI